MKVDLDTCSTCDNFRRLWEIASHEHVKIPMFGFEQVRRMDNMIMFQQDTFPFLVLHSNLYLYYFTIFGLGFLFRLGHRKRSVLYFVVKYLWVLLRSGHVYAGNAILGTPVALVQRSHKKTDSCRIPEKVVGHYVCSSMWHCRELSWTLQRRCT